MLKLSSNNIVISGTGGSPTYNGNITIISENGTIIKSSTNIGSNMNATQIVEHSSGSIIVSGYYSGVMHLSLLDNTGNLLKSSTEVGGNMSSPCIIEANDSNIIAFGHNATTNEANYYILYTFVDNLSLKINNIDLDTNMITNKYYELVYKASLDKFIGKEINI